VMMFCPNAAVARNRKATVWQGGQSLILLTSIRKLTRF
jgi:hypothetical protein